MVTDEVEDFRMESDDTGQEMQKSINRVLRKQQQSSLSSRSNPSPPMKATVNPF